MRSVLCALALVLAAVPAAQGHGRYIGLGDSVAAGPGSYVDRFGGWLSAHRGISDVENVARGGETSTSILGTQLSTAVRLIGDPTDTRYVTVDIGGNDALSGNVCTSARVNDPSCPFADNLAALLARLRRALAHDPGDERLIVMSYYNPESGTGSPRAADIDRWLLGADGRIDTAGFGAAWGMGDVTAWIACRHGAAFVDARPAFEAGGQRLIAADRIHPTPAGQAVLAKLFEHAPPAGGAPACGATTPFVTSLGAAGGVLRGIAEPRMTATHWWVRYGDTSGYGRSTAARTVRASAGPREIAAAVPAGACHARFVVENAVGRYEGDDQVVGTGACTPVRPDTTAPLLRLGGGRLQRLGGAISVAAVCSDEACTARASGRLEAGASFALRPAVAWVGAGRDAMLRLALPAAARRAALRALLAHRRATVAIEVLARDADGNGATARRTIRLRRP